MSTSRGIFAVHERLFDALRKSFVVRTFIFLGAFVLILWSVFAFFFIRHETENVKEALIKQGETLAGLLAYNTRTWVFAENKEMLKESMQGVMDQKNVLEVSIYSNDNRILFIERKEPARKSAGTISLEDKEINAMLYEDETPNFIEGADNIEFLSPVVLESYASAEALYFDNKDLSKKRNVIGYVKVVMDKTFLRQEIKSILFRNTVIALLFLFAGAVIVYVVIHRATRPLARLTKAVEAFGSGESFEKVTVDTPDEIGKLANAFNVMSDNLKKREEEKQAFEAQLRHSQKMEAIGTLTGSIAHDFSNILTSIANCGTILQMRMKKDDPLMEFVSLILSSSERATNLIRGLLFFSRKQMVSLKPININEVIRGFEKFLAQLIGKEIELRISLAEEDLNVFGDSSQIEQVLMNLATNARDAMPDGGQLTISTGCIELSREFQKLHSFGEHGMYALISVSDTGIGIAEETREKIFEPFFTTKEAGKGTGLGLSIVYGVVTQHKGYINCCSEAGKGTVFEIYLPLI